MFVIVMLIVHVLCIVDTTFVTFEQPVYEVLEDIGVDNLALRVCINISNLTVERPLRFMTMSRTAKGLSTELRY